jgi:AcrR family transcriptional regulator
VVTSTESAQAGESSGAEPAERAERAGTGSGVHDAGSVRRTPYGRNPELAAHGVRARKEIINAARRLFAENGYQATTVESIGETTGRSGAAVYQYFEGKAEIFGIFLREAGDDLMAQGSRFPVLTDDRQGQRALEIWVSDIMDLLARHKSTFLLWAPVQFTEPSLAEVGRLNLSRYQGFIVERLAAAGAHPPTPNTVPIGILSIVQWSYFDFLARHPEVSRQRLERALAVILHRYLLSPTGAAEPVRSADDEPEELPNIPLGDAMGLRRPVTARGVGTVQRILLAAADRFRAAGYHATSLSDIAATAGVSHGSVYTYWADRDALFTTLAQDAVSAVEVRAGGLTAALQTSDGLTGWLEGWVSMIGSHGPVLHVWTHEVDNPAIAGLTDRMNGLLDGVAAGFIEASTRAPMDDPDAMRIVLRAVLTDVPYVLSTQLGILPREATCAFVAGLLRAGVGAPSAEPTGQ